MKSKYTSGKTVGKNQTVPIGVGDPRLKPGKIGQTKARQGAEIDIVGLDGKSLIVGGRGLNNPAGQVSPSPLPPDFTSVVIPPMENKPPKTYPGGSGPVIITPTDPTSVSAVWSGNDLVISFNWDNTNDLNDTISQFIVELTTEGVTRRTPSNTFKPDTSQSAQTITVTKSMITSMFNVFKTNFSSICVLSSDPLNNISNTVCAATLPTYVLDLPVPVITVTSISNGYSVGYTAPTQDIFDNIEIVEYESTDLVEPTGVTYVRTFFDKISPAIVISPNFNKRWVKARFSSDAGIYTAYCAAQPVTPTTAVPVDLTPPNEVVSVTPEWSGDSLIIDYVLPATDPGTRFQIQLTAPNSSVGYFYCFPDGTTNVNQSTEISKDDLFFQFKAHYSSFSGVFRSIDASDNRSSGVSFVTGTRPNPLATVIPTFTATGVTNGYTVSYSLVPYAVRAEVYQKYTSWSGITDAIDLFTGTRASGGASGTNTVTLSNVKDNFNNTVTTIPTGYIVEGTGIPSNTYITAVSGNQITLSNNFTENSSGTIEGYALVYSGNSPANLPSTLYQNTYIIIKYYDDFENHSLVSAEQIVVPLSPTVVDVIGPPDILFSGSSTTAGIDTSGTLGFNGYVNISFNAVTDTSLRGYRIRFTTDTSSPNYSYVDYPINQASPPTGTITYKLAGLSVGATYTIAVATYDQFNNTSSNYISLPDATVSGTPAITDYITAGGFQFGQGVDPLNATGITGTKRGVFLDDSNYWFLNSSDSARLKVGGSTSNYLLWNGTKLTVDGDITAKGGSFAGNIALTTSGASIYSGDVTTSPGNLTGDGFIFNSGGLLIRKGSNQVSLDTATGGITANNGAIANWKISTDVIQNNITGSSNKYVGLNSSPTATYSLWAGSSSANGDANKFAVTPEGKLYATDVVISGGSLDVGATSPVSTTMTGTNGATTITVSSATGISAGMYAVGDYIPNFTTVTNVSSTTITLSANNTATIGAGTPVKFIPASGAHITSDGRLFATDAILNGRITAQSGEFTGNVLLKTAGSLYAPLNSGTIPSVTGTTDPSGGVVARTPVNSGSSNITGIIANKNGFAAYNSSGGYAEMLTTPLADGSVFATTAANIGGWKVNANEISKSSLSGGGTISLNSSNGYIAVSNGSVGSYTAGINGAATLALGSNVFWAGSGGPSSASNGFRVTLDGKMYATGAAITGGTVTSANGATDIVTLDGVNNLISMQTSGSSTYLFPRNSNTYLTSGNPFPNSGTGDYANMGNLNNSPYFAAGSGFKDYWGTSNTKGIGLFTGAWDYFAGGSSTPFITATTTGLQLSASPTLGLLLDAGTSATGDKLNPAIATGTPSMLFYTAKKATAPYSPTTEYGAWAAFTNNKIKLTAAGTVFINVDGTSGSQNIEIASTANIWQKFTSSAIKLNVATDIWQQFDSTGIKLSSTSNIWQQFTSSGIRLQSTNSVYQLFDSTSITLASGKTSNTTGDTSAYGGASQIVINSSKVSITGLPRAGTFDMGDYRSNPYYRGTYPLGYPPRQRMVIEDPVSGEAQLGMAVYYLDLTKVNVTLTSGPSNDMGVQGDLAVMF